MAKFFQSNNNGVLALIREDHAKTYALVKKAGGDPWSVGVKVFTFCRSDRNPLDRQYFTGSHEFADRLLIGHEVSKTSGDWDGFVPFSNQDFDDLRFLTSPEDVYTIFELRPSRYPMS